MRYKVNIVQRSKDKGKLEIEFNSQEELEAITDRIRAIREF